ncbi:MAG: hypothetical protein U0232_10585 [Thermomicrobiales bacterium]
MPIAWRRRLATKAFAHTAAYDALIARYLRETGDEGDDEQFFPQQLSIGLEKLQGLRYGENPHQRAAFYRAETPEPTPAGLATARQLHGRAVVQQHHTGESAPAGGVVRAEAVAQGGGDGEVVGGGRGAAVEDEEDERGAGEGLAAAGDAHLLDLVGGVGDAGGVE